MAVRRNPARNPLGLHSGFHLSHLADLLLAQAALGVAEGVDRLDETPTGRLVPRARARPQKRLKLPGVRPASQILGVGVQAAGQRAAAPLWPQIGIDPKGRLAVDVARELHRLGGHLLGEPRGRGRIRAVVGFVHENDVGVGGVPHFPAAGPPHGDDDVGAERAIQPELLAGGGNRPSQSRLDGDVRRARNGGPRGDGIDHPEHLAHGRAQQLAPPEVTARPGDLLGIRPARNHGSQLTFKFLAPAGGEPSVVEEPRHRFGDVRQLSGDVARRRQKDA